MKRTRSVWAGVLSTLITWCYPPVCCTLGINTHSHTNSHTYSQFPGVKVTLRICTYSWNGNSIFHKLLFIISSVWVTSKSFLLSSSIFFPLLHVCHFSSLLLCGLVFLTFTQSLFSFLFLFILLLPLCVFCVSWSWLCVSLYSASSRSSPCLDHDNSRWYSLFWLLSLSSLLIALTFSLICYKMTLPSIPPNYPHDFKMHDFQGPGFIYVLTPDVPISLFLF